MTVGFCGPDFQRCWSVWIKVGGAKEVCFCTLLNGNWGRMSIVEGWRERERTLSCRIRHEEGRVEPLIQKDFSVRIDPVNKKGKKTRQDVKGEVMRFT